MFFIVAKRDVHLKELLDAFGEGNTRQLKQWLRADSAITDCDSHFSDYQELYRKYLCMDNKNAPALLSRALGLKKIDDLTKLIRELVLEPSGVKADARKVVEDILEYGDVKKGILGISSINTNSKYALENGINEIEGVYVGGVEDGMGAADAGIQEGDVIK